MITAMLLMVAAGAPDGPASPMRKPPPAERHMREAVVPVPDTPDVQDLIQRAIFIRDGRQPAIVVKGGTGAIA